MKSLLLFSALILFTFTFIGCEESIDIQAWVRTTDQHRGVARTQAEIIPYRNPQHQALKAYFEDLAQMALSLRTNASLAQRFNQALAQSNMSQMCGKIFIPRSNWQIMMARCSRNRFFLCAEEVRAYPQIVLALKNRLSSDQQRRFDQTATCQAAL